MPDLDRLKQLLEERDNRNKAHGPLIVKHGILTVKASDGMYCQVTMFGGDLEVDWNPKTAKQIKQLAMELEPEEYPLADSIYGA